MTAELADNELWTRYRMHGDPDARDRLYLEHANWARSLAQGIHRRVRAYPVDSEDFVQNARAGLLEAMSRYDPARGIPFRAYATPRVRGAVFNGLRAILGDRHPPKDDARFAARLEHLSEEAEGWLLEQLVETIANLGIGFMLDSAHALPSVELRDGLAYAQSNELETRLRNAVEDLPERLKTVIQAHYFDDVQFQELATQWGVSKPRLSQLHRAALEKLRASLRNAT